MTIEALPLDLAIGFLIGLSLGLLGGGGSILTVPALVYLVGQTPQAAVTTSLAIVGINSAVGTIFHQRQRTCRWGVALIFGGAGMVTAFFAAGLSKHISPAVVMVLFAILMLVIGSMMLLKNQQTVEEQPDICPQEKPNTWKVILAGSAVGILTGILGVGGGFLIVPALVMLVGLPMAQAVGTSLVIIAANSFAGLLGHTSMPLEPWLIISFAAAGVVGTFAGSQLGHRLPASLLRKSFAGFVLILAIFLLIDNVPKIVA